MLSLLTICTTSRGTWQKIGLWKVYISPPPVHQACQGPACAQQTGRLSPRLSPPRSRESSRLSLLCLAGWGPGWRRRLARSGPHLISGRTLSRCHLIVGFYVRLAVIFGKGQSVFFFSKFKVCGMNWKWLKLSSPCSWRSFCWSEHERRGRLPSTIVCEAFSLTLKMRY